MPPIDGSTHAVSDILRSILRFIPILVGLGLPVHASVSDFAAQLQKKMPSLLSQYNIPGAEIACIHNGDIAWNQAYGALNVNTNEPLRAGLVFNFGSCGKVLTAWGIMRLVEEGQINLDAPANRYIKRYQIRSSQFDPNQVTIRRLLSHTAGLTVHGFSDYPAGAPLPSLVDMLNGKNQSDGSVHIKWSPGSQMQYSGGGFVILQMIIEDVTGQSFADFIGREVADPLGMASLRWSWNPELTQRAAIPYDSNNQPVGYRQLGCQAIGSEVATVSDFAVFVAATTEGPKGEPAGRGVLKPQTVQQMLQAQANTGGTVGLGYGLQSILGERIALHSGGNPGWRASFVIDPKQREGFVFASSSSNGSLLASAIGMLWFQTVLYPLLLERFIMWLSTSLGLALLLSILWLRSQIRSGKRNKFSFKLRRIFIVLPWVVFALIWGVLFYTSLLIRGSFSGVWPTTVHLMTTVFAGWIIASLGIMLLPPKKQDVKL
jgi:CubicO group peptidase (beta-lactamase class C family)